MGLRGDGYTVYHIHLFAVKFGNVKCNGFFEIPVSVFCGQLEIVISHNISNN